MTNSHCYTNMLTDNNMIIEPLNKAKATKFRIVYCETTKGNLTEIWLKFDWNCETVVSFDEDAEFLDFSLKNSKEDFQEVLQSQNIANQWHQEEEKKSYDG